MFWFVLIGGLVTLLALWIANGGSPVQTCYWKQVQRHNARKEYLANTRVTTMQRKV